MADTKREAAAETKRDEVEKETKTEATEETGEIVPEGADEVDGYVTCVLSFFRVLGEPHKASLHKTLKGAAAH